MAKANNSSSSTPADMAGAYQLIHGVQVSIERGCAQDYAHMRAVQLHALLEVLAVARQCEHAVMGEQAAANAHWLASSLAEELVRLIEMLPDDGRPIASALRRPRRSK
jgi:hypothetical protein